MISSKIVILAVLCLAVRAQVEDDNKCKKFSDEINQHTKQMEEQIKSMTPVLKDFLWRTFELEFQVREMRERLDRFTASAHLVKSSPPVQQSEPEQKVVTARANIFTRQPPAGFTSSLVEKLTPPLVDSGNANDNLTLS